MRFFEVSSDFIQKWENIFFHLSLSAASSLTVLQTLINCMFGMKADGCCEIPRKNKANRGNLRSRFLG